MNNENKLFIEYKKTKDKKIREELINSHLYIARLLAKRFINRGVDYEDIYQVAVMGIIYAVDRFDAERGVIFATFATPTVLGEIRKYFRDKGNFIKVPRSLCSVFYKAEKIRNSNNENLSKEELARRLNISVTDLEKAYEIGDVNFIKSLEYEANAEGTHCLSNIVGTDDNNYLMIEDKDFIKQALNSLSELEKNIIKLRYYKEKTQQETANEIGVSQMQISRMEKNLLKKLRDLYFHN